MLARPSLAILIKNRWPLTSLQTSFISKDPVEDQQDLDNEEPVHKPKKQLDDNDVTVVTRTFAKQQIIISFLI